MQQLVVHNVGDFDEITILSESDKALLPNIYIYTARLKPFNGSFNASTSFLVSMVVSGSVCGQWKAVNSDFELALQPGSIAIIPPNLPFEVSVDSYGEVINIYFSQKMMRDIGIEFSREGKRQFNIGLNLSVTDPFMEQIILSIKELLDHGGTFSKIETEYLVRTLVSRVISRCSTPVAAESASESGLSPNVLQKTLDYIDRNLHRRISLERLAMTAGIGPAQFSRLFKRATSVTLHQYIILRRIERARGMLTETDLPIAEIAQECGFADQVHLTRFFGRVVGTSPASFRRSARG